uniref:Uncharacterized protein n=1 Tax=Strombidium rassoulzadegani TaxID=1082188 RepID=A0A7S3CSH0_9SPIT|mmetsp:Transcript_6762/g.11355  ORF Transcript_6762/g.11355 Transcript_6762/m.11355 type:complete len:259 (+) Transcript_6762:31-807(+)
MGCKMCTQSRGLPQKDGGDLPVANLANIRDPLERFEKDFPFYRMEIAGFRQIIYSFGRDKFSIRDLAQRLPAQLWQSQLQPNSKLVRLLMELPGSEPCEQDSLETLIDTNNFLLLAFIWCGGSLEDKGEALFQCLNPPGQSQTGVSANDKEWDKVFDQLCYLATVWTAQQGQREGINCKQYDEEETSKAIKAMRLSELEEPEKVGFIMLVFGYDSKVSKEDFLNVLSQSKCSWVFRPLKIRERLETFQDADLIDEVLG